ncbi:hypothetical protein MMC13_007166 [Lambiella insularis]|nr:hypothetical protein [Lambiella insularis]
MATSVDAKLLKQTKFPAEFTKKVDMQKVNVEVMKKWIAGKISEILGNEDDVVIELCFNLLEGARFPDIKVLQIQLTGFLDKDTARFCKELWSLCLSAQSNAQGVPKELLEAKKLELIQEKVREDPEHSQLRTDLPSRSMPRKLLRRPPNVKSRKGYVTVTSTVSGNVREASEAVDVAEVVAEGRRTTIEGLPDIPVPHHLDAGSLRRETAIVVHLLGEKLTLTYLAVVEDVEEMIEEDAHHLLDALSRPLDHDQSAPCGDADTLRADHQHLYVEEQVMEEVEGLLIVVMTAEITGDKADQGDHFPITLTKMINLVRVLIMAKGGDIMVTGTVAQVTAAVESVLTGVYALIQVAAEALLGGGVRVSIDTEIEIGRGIAQSNDMLLQEEDGGTHHLSLLLWTSGVKRPTLLAMKRVEKHRSSIDLHRHQGLGEAKRWVVIHRVPEKKYCLTFIYLLTLLEPARSSTLTTTELRERLLREKVLALRKSGTGASEQAVNVT